MNTTRALLPESSVLHHFLSLNEKILSLDLEAIKFKLVFDAHGPRWSAEKVNQLEPLYKQFFFLVGKHPDKKVVPFSEEIDTFWHYHILDTIKYRQDCAHVFGRFIDHFPYLGLRGEEDALLLQESFEQTCSLYEQEFETSLSQISLLSVGCKNCAPVPSCSGEPSPTIENQVRPSLKDCLSRLH